MDKTIFLYNEATAPALDCAALAAFLQQTFGAPAETKDEFVSTCLAGVGEARQKRLDTLARQLARIRVRHVNRPRSFADPLPLEIDAERRRLADHNRGSMGMALDGFEFQALLRSLLPPPQLGLGLLHIVFTNRLLATWQPDDLRYHLRTIILGQPAVVSTSGLVEAPAKPRQYYLTRQSLPDDELARAALRRQFAGRFLEYGDPRTTAVAQGYCLQAAFYLWLGETFCDNPDCRLFNAHWQEEMLHAQTRPHAGLCDKHTALLEK